MQQTVHHECVQLSLITYCTSALVVLFRDSTSSHTCSAPASVLRMCCLMLFTLGCLGSEIVLTLSASCTVSSSSSHSISSSSASPSTFRVRMSSSWLMTSLQQLVCLPDLNMDSQGLHWEDLLLPCKNLSSNPFSSDSSEPRSTCQE